MLSNTVATCGYGAPEMWLVQIEVGYECKVHAGLQRLNTKKKKRTSNISLIIISLYFKNDTILDIPS